MYSAVRTAVRSANGREREKNKIIIKNTRHIFVSFAANGTDLVEIKSLWIMFWSSKTSKPASEETKKFETRDNNDAEKSSENGQIICRLSWPSLFVSVIRLFIVRSSAPKKWVLCIFRFLLAFGVLSAARTKGQTNRLHTCTQFSCVTEHFTLL